MSSPRALLQAIQDSYRLEVTDGEWLSRLANRLAELTRTREGAVAFRLRVASQCFHPWQITLARPCTLDHVNMLLNISAHASSALKRRLRGMGTRCGSLSNAGLLDIPEVIGVLREHIKDSINFVVVEHDGEGCAFLLPAAETKRLHQRTRRSWQQMLVHMAAGFRLRRLRAADILAAVAGFLDHDEIEALQATFARGAWSVRDMLRRVVRSVDQAFVHREHNSKELAETVYRGVFTGRWKLIDHFDEGERRFVIARRVEPEGSAPLRLTPSELEVVRRAMEWSGDTYQGIAQRIGTSLNHVSNHLSRALDKIGVHNRIELITVMRVEFEQ